MHSVDVFSINTLGSGPETKEQNFLDDHIIAKKDLLEVHVLVCFGKCRSKQMRIRVHVRSCLSGSDLGAFACQKV